MDPNTIFYLGTERTAMNSLVPFLPVPQGRTGLRHALTCVLGLPESAVNALAVLFLKGIHPPITGG